MKSILYATLASLALTAPAFATNFCQERTVDGGTELVDGGTEVIDLFKDKAITVSSWSGKDGWDGIGGQCKWPGNDTIFVGPRNAKGECLTPASLVGTNGGAIVKIIQVPDGQKIVDLPDYEVELPDIEEYREFGWQQTGPHPWNGYFGWGEWAPGDC